MYTLRHAIKRYRQFLKSTSGLGLIELAIVLAIMGILAGTTLPMMSHYQNVSRQKVSAQNMETVLYLMASYTARHGKLPCPTVSLDDGTTKESCKAPSDRQGFVPYKSLGLPKSVATDGWGNGLRYAIAYEDRNRPIDKATERSPLTPEEEHHLARYDKGRNSFIPEMCKNVYTDNPVVYDSQKISVLEKEDKNSVIVVLGAFNDGTNPESDLERTNTEPDLTFIDAPYSKNKEALFRHQIRWLTFDHFTSVYGHFRCNEYHANQIDEPEEKPEEIHESDYDDLLGGRD